MIDTIDIFYYFPHRIQYDTCFDRIDTLARNRGQALHKHRGKKNQKKTKYITKAFANSGILQITFQKEKYKYRCTMLLKPALMIHPNTKLRLANKRDYSAFCHAINAFIESVNTQCGEALLPSAKDWRVKRIDYAVNIFTPHVAEYIQLFYAGNHPKGFDCYEQHEGSVYWKSKNGTINFYDKLQQVRNKKNKKLSDADIENELRELPSEILRLEFQCRNKYIQYIKDKYGLETTTLPYLWNAEIAENELKSRVESIIGENDFFSYDICKQKLEQHYERRTLALCCQIIRFLRDSQCASLHDMKMVSGKYLPNILHKIRKVGINPIPLDGCKNCSVTELQNPYRLIRCE